MARIGIMGGTFNPIHHVHLIMAEEARRQFRLKKVLFMPSKNPPHKEKKSIVSDAHRKRMIKHAIADNPHFEFSDVELKREGTTYTRDTLAFLKERHPDAAFYFILGGDSLASMESWYEPEEIFANCHILAAGRDDTDGSRIQKWMAFYREKYKARISEIHMPLLAISSEMIRKKLDDGHSISDYVPSCVERYIRANALYGCQEPLFEKTPPTPELIKVLSANLKPKRMLHTHGVAVTAANLAGIYGCQTKDAYVAGLLHDCAKYLTAGEQLQLCEENQIFLTDVEKQNPVLIHGKLGAFFAKSKYRIEDEEILSAIAFHTTGRPAMKLLEKILYLADYMEPGRDMDCAPYSLTEIRRMCFADIDKAMAMVLTNSVTYLEKQKQPIDTLTIDTWKYYRKYIDGHADSGGFKKERS